MEIDKALSQISQIHEHLSRSEVYRDYRALPVALSGLVAVGAAAAQPVLVGGPEPRNFAAYWLVVALLCGLVCGGGIIHRYLRETNPQARRRTRIVLGQFLPCVAAGIAVTAALYQSDPAVFAMLPGLWALLFGLGVFASRPYLPRSIGFVALYYLVCGFFLLTVGRPAAVVSGWPMGLTFGTGQIFAGIVLYWNLERNGNGWTHG